MRGIASSFGGSSATAVFSGGRQGFLSSEVTASSLFGDGGSGDVTSDSGGSGNLVWWSSGKSIPTERIKIYNRNSKNSSAGFLD
mmetsp:Transcript_14994/g.27272  ORF Transcript_14994/g.27272 Transcript_14994/m.27272 type:complete len:84 (+) Transcript_14994:168-419(+)